MEKRSLTEEANPPTGRAAGEQQVARELAPAGSILPTPQTREPDEFIDATWLRLLYFEEAVLEGFRLSRRMVSTLAGGDPRPVEETMYSLRGSWFNAVREGRAPELAQYLAKNLTKKFFPFHQIFARLVYLLSCRGTPTTWPLAVAALLDGLIHGHRLQSAHFASALKTPGLPLPPDTNLGWSWGMVNGPQSVSYVGSKMSDEMIAQQNTISSGRTVTRRLDRRDPRLYREIASSLIQGRSIVVSDHKKATLLAGYRMHPKALIFFRIGDGTSYEIPFQEWINAPAPDESITLFNVDEHKPGLPYEVPDLLAI